MRLDHLREQERVWGSRVGPRAVRREDGYAAAETRGSRVHPGGSTGPREAAAEAHRWPKNGVEAAG